VRTCWAQAEFRCPHKVRGLPDPVLIGPSLDPQHVILVGQQLLELRTDLAPLQREGSGNFVKTRKLTGFDSKTICLSLLRILHEGLTFQAGSSWREFPSPITSISSKSTRQLRRMSANSRTMFAIGAFTREPIVDTYCPHAGLQNGCSDSCPLAMTW
jgi:hypothetical protein